MDYKKIIRSRAARENILRALAFIPDEAMLRIQYRIKTGPGAAPEASHPLHGKAAMVQAVLSGPGHAPLRGQV